MFIFQNFLDALADFMHVKNQVEPSALIQKGVYQLSLWSQKLKLQMKMVMYSLFRDCHFAMI